MNSLWLCSEIENLHEWKPYHWNLHELAGFKIDGKILPENIYKLYKTIECDVQDVDAVFL